MSPSVHILRTGTANLASVAAAIERCGRTAVVTSSASDVDAAVHLVVPGVGAFAPAMACIEECGHAKALRGRIARGRETLCICLGMQVLFDESEESPGVRGLGVVPGRITRFARDARLRVPQLGWNTVEPCGDFDAFSAGFAYYANSFRFAEPIGGFEGAIGGTGWSYAATNYGGRFVAALQRRGVLACQFHPELSGVWGELIIRRWLTSSS